MNTFYINDVLAIYEESEDVKEIDSINNENGNDNNEQQKQQQQNPSRYERILWISPNNEFCYTITLNDNKIKYFPKRQISDLKLGLEAGWIKLEESDLWSVIYDEQKLKRTEIEKRDNKFEIAKYILESVGEPHIYQSEYLGKAVRDAREKYKRCKTTIYKYLREYLQSGKIKDSLIPRYNKCGANGSERNYTKRPGRFSKDECATKEKKGVIINDEIKDIFKIGTYQWLYNRKQKISLRKVYKLIIARSYSYVVNGERIYADKDSIPSYDQYVYWLKKQDFYKKLIKGEGEKAYNLLYRPLLSDTVSNSFGPGYKYEIDSTNLDICLINSFNRKRPIGCVTLYLAVDVFSRLIAGFYLGVTGESWDGILSLLYNCNEDKVEHLKKHGFNIQKFDYPCEGLPVMIIADRGKTIGPIADKIIESLNIGVENVGVGRGDLKPNVEQAFNQITKDIVAILPGARIKKKRGEKDYRFDAALTIEDLTRAVIAIILERNSRIMEDYPLSADMIKDGVIPTPNNIWDWGMKNRTGNLRKIDRDTLIFNLMRSGEARVTGRGIKFGKYHYSCAYALENHWFSKARKNSSWTVKVAYDKRDLSSIYLLNTDGNSTKYIECSMLDRDSRRLGNLITEEEMNDLILEENEKENNYENQKIKGYTDKNLVLTDIRNKALENQKGINKYDRERISNITQSRNEEKLRRDKEDAFTNYVKNEENAGNIDKTQKGTDYHDSEDFIFEYMSIKNKDKDKGDENI